LTKDSDSSLVSNENFSETLWSSGLAQVRYQQPKMAKTYLAYMMSLTKNPKP